MKIKWQLAANDMKSLWKQTQNTMLEVLIVPLCISQINNYYTIDDKGLFFQERFQRVKVFKHMVGPGFEKLLGQVCFIGS